MTSDTHSSGVARSVDDKGDGAFCFRGEAKAPKGRGRFAQWRYRINLN